MDAELKLGESICEINEDLRLIQRTDGIKFGTDSYLLSAFIKKNLRGECADLGAGSGVISLFAAARCSFDKIHSIEIQHEFAELIARNASLNGFAEKIVPHELDVRRVSDNFAPESMTEVFSNPPYMKCGSGKGNEAPELNAARREENGTIDDFCRCAAYLLKYGGTFRCVYRPERTASLIAALRENSLEPKRMIFVHPDSESPPSLVLTEAKKGGSEGLKISRPLIIYDGANNYEARKYTEDTERVYEEFSLEHLFDK